MMNISTALNSSKLLISIIMITALGHNAYTQDYERAKKMGSFGDDRGLSIASDASGNVYTTGYFKETVDFDPGIGIDSP